MKIACLFLLLVGLAAAKPSPSLVSLDNTLFLNGNFKNITKAQFEILLKQRDAFLQKYDGVIMPAALVKFIRSVTVDDYEALKRILELSEHDITTEVSNEFLDQYPDMAKRLLEVVQKVTEQVQQVSKPTMNRLIKTKLLHGYLKTTRNLTNEEDMKILVKEYLSWPRRAKEDLDKIFPKLSVKAEEWTGSLANDDSIPTLNQSLCNIRVKHDLCEQYRLFSMREQVAKMMGDLSIEREE